jgi:Uma2 family endonuclease
MIQHWQRTLSGSVIYPESDGLPMADNTKQARWIVVLFGNLSALFRADANVFVAADHFWYPVEGDPNERAAPDVFVVLGRPKGDRSSYRQWEEQDVPPTVVFEVLSPSNKAIEMAEKLDFYDRHGVQEYYLYDPDVERLVVYLRRTQLLTREHFGKSFVSPRLGIRFDLTGPEMKVFYPDGEPFLTFEQMQDERQRERQQRLQAEQRASEADQRASEADQRASEADQLASEATQRAARLAELSRKARRGEASPEELLELEKIEEQFPPAG